MSQQSQLPQVIFRVATAFLLSTATEYVLEKAGLDTLADYSEFLNGQQELVILNNTVATETFALPPIVFG